MVDLTEPDGTTLRATYFAAGEHGPGMPLTHQATRDHKIWEEVVPRGRMF